MPKAISDLPTMIKASTLSTEPGSSKMIRGSNSMPTDTKNSTENAVLQRQRLGRRFMAEVGFAKNQSGEERAQRKGDAEKISADP